jgi:hypothetical protein
VQFTVSENADTLERLLLIVRVLVVDQGQAHGEAVMCFARLDKNLDLIHIAYIGT